MWSTQQAACGWEGQANHNLLGVHQRVPYEEDRYSPEIMWQKWWTIDTKCNQPFQLDKKEASKYKVWLNWLIYVNLLDSLYDPIKLK